MTLLTSSDQMGLCHSSLTKKDSVVFFSEFRKAAVKGGNERCLFDKLGLKLPLCPDYGTMDTLVHLWWVNCLSKSKWHTMLPVLRNRVMQDFIDTLYCTSNSFDEIFMLFFVSAKSRYYMLGHNKKLGLSSGELRDLAEDILRYASAANVKFSHRRTRLDENLIDFPLKTFSLCPCTRRPLYVAMYLGRPDVVRLLLNCGARIPYEDVCVCTTEDVRRHPLSNVMDVMKAPLKVSNNDDLMKSHRGRSILSLRALLVDVCHTTDLCREVWKVLKEISPGDKTESVIPTLKHICRHSIRLRMKSNRSLSSEDVFEDLRLPKSLIAYLNIEERFELPVDESSNVE